MNHQRVSRNDSCPCGSGRKFKKCCYNRERTITQLDRAMAIELIEQYVASCDKGHEARNAFCGGFDLDVPAMTDHFRETSDAAFLFWFAFDCPFDDGSYVVDRILKANPLLSTGERRPGVQAAWLKEGGPPTHHAVALRRVWGDLRATRRARFHCSCARWGRTRRWAALTL